MLARQVIAVRDILKGTELTVEYGKGYWEDQHIKPGCDSSDSPTSSANWAYGLSSTRIDAAAVAPPLLCFFLPRRPCQAPHSPCRLLSRQIAAVAHAWMVASTPRGGRPMSTPLKAPPPLQPRMHLRGASQEAPPSPRGSKQGAYARNPKL